MKIMSTLQVLGVGIIAMAAATFTSLEASSLKGGKCYNCAQDANAQSCAMGQATAGAACNGTTNGNGLDTDCPGTSGKKCNFSQQSQNNCNPQPNQPCPAATLYKCVNRVWVSQGSANCGNKGSCTQNNG